MELQKKGSVENEIVEMDCQMSAAVPAFGRLDRTDYLYMVRGPDGKCVR